MNTFDYSNFPKKLSSWHFFLDLKWSVVCPTVIFYLRCLQIVLYLKMFSSNISYFSSLDEFELGRTETTPSVSTSGGPQVRTELHDNLQIKLTLLFLEPKSMAPFWEHSLSCTRDGVGQGCVKIPQTFPIILSECSLHSVLSWFL